MEAAVNRSTCWCQDPAPHRGRRECPYAFVSLLQDSIISLLGDDVRVPSPMTSSRGGASAWSHRHPPHLRYHALRYRSSCPDSHLCQAQDSRDSALLLLCLSVSLPLSLTRLGFDALMIDA